jgi:starch-binding outer membrane protein, SusD/RagB family
MKKLIKSIIPFLPIILITGLFPSCEKFLSPNQEINITEDKLYTDWYEYRSAVLGLYALQQQLVDQIIVLGELRGDLLTVTKNSDPDLMEIYNFDVSKENKYASPQKFFRLIAATNRFLDILEKEHPNVLDPSKTVNNYDRLYGEALCMRAWAYFNAVRIYGKVPFIDQRLSTIEEINQFINTPSTYVDSIYIKYSIDGYHNDTIRNQQVVLEKNYFDTDRVIRYFTDELERKVKVENGIKAVGVNHYIENNDNSWEVSIWSVWSYNTLLGQMYLTLGDLTKSIGYFEKVVNNGTTNYRYQLDYSFAYTQWGNIFMNIDSREHIFTIWFNKANQQQNNLQELFEPWGSNKYMLKPTQACVHKWETEWRGARIRYDYIIPDSTKTLDPGIPSDFCRGFGFSYVYIRNNGEVPDYTKMLEYKRLKEYRSVENIMENVDTVVYKYSINKDRFDHDANFIIYRAAGVNLYMAEIYNYWNFLNNNGTVGSYTMNALKIINDGSYYDASVSRTQRGIRGRVGLDPLTVQNINFIFDPFTNKVVGWEDLTGNLLAKQNRLEDQIMEERAKELAFEGERYYDLMRVANRRNDPSFLAKKVADKYPASQHDRIYNLLLDKKNWYINYFE